MATYPEHCSASGLLKSYLSTATCYRLWWPVISITSGSSPGAWFHSLAVVLKHCCDVRLVKHCERFVCLAYPRDGAGGIMFFWFYYYYYYYTCTDNSAFLACISVCLLVELDESRLTK